MAKGTSASHTGFSFDATAKQIRPATQASHGSVSEKVTLARFDTRILWGLALDDSMAVRECPPETVAGGSKELARCIGMILKEVNGGPVTTPSDAITALGTVGVAELYLEGTEDFLRRRKLHHLRQQQGDLQQEEQRERVQLQHGAQAELQQFMHKAEEDHSVIFRRSAQVVVLANFDKRIPWGLVVQEGTMELLKSIPNSAADHSPDVTRCMGMILFQINGAPVHRPAEIPRALAACDIAKLHFAPARIHSPSMQQAEHSQLQDSHVGAVTNVSTGSSTEQTTADPPTRGATAGIGRNAATAPNAGDAETNTTTTTDNAIVVTTAASSGTKLRQLLKTRTLRLQPQPHPLPQPHHSHNGSLSPQGLLQYSGLPNLTDQQRALSWNA